MDIFIRTFTLSFSVFGRMILPVLGISIASFIITNLLNLVTAGLAGYLSGPVTATFISLFGIRVALSVLGHHGRPMYDMMILFSVLYGVFFIIAKGVLLLLPEVVAVLIADGKLGDVISIQNFLQADSSLQFAFYVLSIKTIVSFVLYTSIYVAMAVPMANAARSASQGSASAGFFTGFGRSFLPLFCIFAVPFLLQFLFGFLASLYVLLPLVLSVISIVFSQTLPDFDLDIIVNGLVASACLLWLHSLIWSASAVALTKSDKTSKQIRAAKAPPAAEKPDLRALRKSRE
ncbi:MAG: hypothetical protein ABJH45_06225 [Paracoccaceae bacterium]